MTKDIIINVVPSCLACFFMSFIICRFLIPFPESLFENAMNNAVNGMLNGGISSLLTTIAMYIKYRKVATLR